MRSAVDAAQSSRTAHALSSRFVRVALWPKGKRVFERVLGEAQFPMYPVWAPIAHRREHRSHEKTCVVQACSPPGLPRQRAFGNQTGVFLASLGYWLKKERSPVTDDSRRVESTFVELELIPLAPTVARADDRPDELVVELPLGVVLRFKGSSR